ncbi:MAG: two-component sensor histidine kinase [Ponticaulis sp.]|nr:two-component sensor histidine kinase [Ponticaulis sp.]
MGQNATQDDVKSKTTASILTERARRRDFVVLAFLVLVIVIILFASGTISASEGITAFLIFVFSAIAFYLSTEPESSRKAFVANEPPSSDTKTDGATISITEIQKIINAYPEAALVCGYDGRVVSANPLAIDVFRLPRSGMGLSPSIIRRPDVLDSLENMAEGRTLKPLEIEVAGNPDRYFRVSLQALRLMGNDLVLIALDELTELRRAEKARADFLANASHELRTPLTSLSGFIETMRGPAKDDPEAWDRFLEIMHGQTDRMRRLIHDLLSLSRIELNEHRRPDQKINLSGVVAENVEALVPIATDKGIELELISSADSAPVHGVRDELVQVIQNLIDNALKYTSSGSKVRVEVSAGLDLEQARTFAGRRWVSASRVSIVQSTPEQGARFAVLRVSDEGAGIPRQHLPRLGERFYRVDEGRDRSVGGTGLGLAIVKHIVARHRGGLMVESEEGYGSAFGIWLPMIAEAAEPQNTAPSGAPPSGPPETN